MFRIDLTEETTVFTVIRVEAVPLFPCRMFSAQTVCAPECQ
jgi:hypothetical protein